MVGFGTVDCMEGCLARASDGIENSVRRALVGRKYRCTAGAQEILVDGVETGLQVDPNMTISPNHFTPCSESGCFKHQWPLAGWPPKNLDVLAQLLKPRCLGRVVDHLNNIAANTFIKFPVEHMTVLSDCSAYRRTSGTSISG